MDAIKKQALAAAGIEADSALERFMGNEALLARFMKKFLEDTNYRQLAAALEEGNMEAALRTSHTLKGVCGNLSMFLLFDLLTRQVAALRAGNSEEALALMPEITAAYEQACQTIREVLE